MAQQKIPLTAIVFNDNAYGNVKRYQERDFGGHVIGTELHNPDMLKLAECRYKLNRPQDARATWEKIVAGFPGTAAATAAQQRLASLSAGKPASPE